MGNSELEFYIDGQLQDEITGYTDWEKKTYDVNSTSPVTLKWLYSRGSTGGSDTDCGFVDFVRYSGTTTETPPDIRDWQTKVEYKYDTSGRRIKKKVDNYTVRYIYDSENVIGEYDINEKWYLPFQLDVGGGDSDLTWQVFAAVGYRYENFDLIAGYRHMEWELETDKPLKDISMSGPIIGAMFKF